MVKLAICAGAPLLGRRVNNNVLSIIGCLHDPANVQHISKCILNTFAGSLLDVCWIV